MLAALILIASLGLSSPQGIAGANQSDTEFARGVDLQQRGDLDGARDAYEASLKAQPRRFEALSNLGVVYAKLGKYDRAIDLYRRALGVEPSQQSIRLNLGIAYYKMARFDLAEPELSKVIAAQPDNHQARLLRGLCLYQTDKLTPAISDLERVHAALPEDLGASYGLTLAYIAANQLDKANALARNVFSRIDSAEAHLVLGSLASANRDFPKAIEELSRAKQIDPNLPTVSSRLGTTYLMSGERDQAIAAFNAEIEVNPNDFDANARLASLYREDGKLDLAEARIDKALELRPDDPGMLYQKALVAQKTDRIEEAVTLLERVTTILPDFNPAHVLLARLYYKVKRTDDAARQRAIIDRLTEEQQKKQPGGNVPETSPGTAEQP